MMSSSDSHASTRVAHALLRVLDQQRVDPLRQPGSTSGRTSTAEGIALVDVAHEDDHRRVGVVERNVRPTTSS